MAIDDVTLYTQTINEVFPEKEDRDKYRNIGAVAMRLGYLGSDTDISLAFERFQKMAKEKGATTVFNMKPHIAYAASSSSYSLLMGDAYVWEGK